MTTQGNGQNFPYQLSMSQQTEAVLMHLHGQAMHAGTGQKFLAAYRHILERLRRDPLIFGEPQYRLPALKLLVRQAVVSPTG